jgi:asparagine synthase (glutamine-hydrolysing)
MCGIAGIVMRSGEPVDQDALRRIDRSVAHRGPDDAGVWSRPGGDVAFAHRRLSILDLSQCGHQPYVMDDGRYAITYNGEIYNFRALRTELIASGHRFRSESDTEVILAGYATHGTAFIERLRGMFAFAIWDERQRACIVARDRFGIKPFYYAGVGGRFVFASSVRAVAASGLVSATPDPDAIQLYLRSGSVPEPGTLLKDVRTLEAGTIGTWRDGRLQTNRYWSIAFAPADTTWDTAVSTTRAALIDSVEHHFVSDVPVGVFVSGGIDSNALVALATKTRQEPLHTFSIAFPEEAGDEGPAARRSADHFGTIHHEWPLDGAAGRQLFDRFITAADQPSIDGLNTFAVSKVARDFGMKVVLSGVGGDEIFGGYKSFRSVPRLTKWHRRLQLAGVGAVSGRIAGTAGAKGRRVEEWLDGPVTLSRTYEMFRGIFTGDEARILTAHFLGADPSAPAPLPDPPPGDDADRISALELSRYMRNQLLRDADVMSMAWGLELRVPFLDHELFARVAAIPSALRLQPHKRLLTASVGELPEWIVNQPKRGFLFPIARWLGDEWQDVFTGLDRTLPVPLESWYRKWCVFMLDRWLQTMRNTTND